MTLSQTICDFVTLAIQAGGWMEMDRIYLQNRILGMIGEEDFESATVRPVEEISRGIDGSNWSLKRKKKSGDRRGTC